MGEGNRYMALDGLRGVFALSVALYHFYAGEWVLGQAWYGNLFLLVDFFFVLSGFVIWTAYGARVRDTPSAAGFLVKRFGRLWPLHAAVLAALLALELVKLAISLAVNTDTQAFSGTSSLPAFFASLGLVHALGIFDVTVWNGPSWSISVEIFAYLVFVFIAMTRRRALLLTWAVLALALAAVIAGGEYLTSSARFAFPRCLLGFSIGVLIAMAGQASRPLYSRTAGTLLEAGCVVSVVAVLMLVSTLAATLWALPVFAIGVWVFAGERGAVSSLLRSPVFRYLGERSYAIYIVHFLVVKALFRVGQTIESASGVTLYVERNWSHFGMSDTVWTLATPNILADLGAYAAYLALVLLTAEIGYRWIEQPCRRWFRELGDQIEQRLRGRRLVTVTAASKP